MLEQLRIENFALVEKITVDFHPGLNILTGETGAGKSLMVDALGLLLGERASAQYIRTGADRALVEGYFTYSHEEVTRVLSDLGLETSPEDGLMLSREITQAGKNYCRINGKIVPLSMFQAVGRLLVDIHGQNEQLSLLVPDRQLALLDLRGGEQLRELLNRVKEIYRQLKTVERELAELAGDPDDREKRMDYYRYQLSEIEQAKLQEGEEEELLQRKKILQNGEKLLTGVSEAYDLLFKGMAQVSAYDQLSRGIAHLQPLVSIDESLQGMLALGENCLYQLDELARELQDYLANADFDPAELDRVTQRLELIGNLKRKYGATVKDILDYRDRLQIKLEELDQQEGKVAHLQQEKERLAGDYDKWAQALSDLRRQVAEQLERETQESLRQLDMPAVRFECRFRKAVEGSSTGWDEMEFYISPNPGEPLKPLAKIASGGEMARIMLALKAILAGVEAVETMVFDEADSGIGGLTALKVGQKLVQIAKSRQVICITHSPQIASFGDHHLLLYKTGVDGRTVTGIKLLEGQDKILELARMLGGGPGDTTAVQHAQKLLEDASKEKNQ